MDDSGYDSEDVEAGYKEEELDVIESLICRLSLLTTRTDGSTENVTGV